MKKRIRKKTLLTVIVFGIILFLQSCSSNSITTDTTNKDNQCKHDWEKATCEKPITCKKCGLQLGEALEHEIVNGTCTLCGKSFGTWESGEFVDEFKQPTGKKYIVTTVEGTFSNSATTNSDLLAAVQVTSSDVTIMLWEYSWNLVQCSYKCDNYSVVMLDTNSKKTYLDGKMYEGSSRITFDDHDEELILKELKKTGKISFYITDEDRTTTNYLFTIETSNFSSLYSQIK